MRRHLAPTTATAVAVALAVAPAPAAALVGDRLPQDAWPQTVQAPISFGGQSGSCQLNSHMGGQSISIGPMRSWATCTGNVSSAVSLHLTHFFSYRNWFLIPSSGGPFPLDEVTCVNLAGATCEVLRELGGGWANTTYTESATFEFSVTQGSFALAALPYSCNYADANRMIVCRTKDSFTTPIYAGQPTPPIQVPLLNDLT